MWQIISKFENQQNWNKLGDWWSNKSEKVAVYDTHTKGIAKLKDMLGINILKFLSPVLEDKRENVTYDLNENFQLVLIKVPSLVLREHIKFIKETLMEKHNALLVWGIFPDRLKTATMTSLHEKGDKNISIII